MEEFLPKFQRGRNFHVSTALILWIHLEITNYVLKRI